MVQGDGGSTPSHTTNQTQADRQTGRERVEALMAARGQAAVAEAVAPHYALAITAPMAAALDPTDPTDPIARQFLPDRRELEDQAGETPDPIGDDPHTVLPGLVHRYPDRVLLKLLSVCPVYCRFCFRRARVGPGQGAMTPDQIDAAIAYVAARPAIREVILSGGDPLMLSPRALAALATRLGAIAYVDVLRLHSRVPVVAPDRVTADLVAALDRRDLAVWLAVHSNHAREFTPAAEAGLTALRRAGVTLVGQTVLLAGVNDDAAALETLFRRMVRLGIKPYYLHHLDRAPGTGHFRLKLADGLALLRALRGRVSGLCLPHYMLDLPGGAGKVAIAPDDARQEDDGSWVLRDFRGNTHRYREV